jgi:hypothetical protein
VNTKWSALPNATLPLTGSEIISVAIAGIGNYQLTVAQLAAQLVLTGTGSPVGNITPIFVGQLYTDNTTPGLYISTGLTNTAWNQLI